MQISSLALVDTEGGPLKMTQDFKGQVTLRIFHGVKDLQKLWTENHEDKKQLHQLIYDAIKGDGDDHPVILKVHSTLFGVDLRFDSRTSCSVFLNRYKDGDMEFQLNRGLASNHQDRFTISLQVRDQVLDKRDFHLSKWLRLIGQNEPTALQDDEMERMQQDLSILNLNPRDASGGDLVNSNAGPSSSCQLGGNRSASNVDSSPQACTQPAIPTHDACLSAPMVIPENTFLFQEILYDDRQISADDHNNFAKKVGNGWKPVARQLMRTCKGLEDPTIENIAHEYNIVYEQAFQMLRKFMQSEGKRATLSRLVKALVDEQLCNVVECLLGI
ncbi:unnamed protein product [Lampetra fluviatilis]